MQKKEITWIVILLVVAGLYCRFFTHWFAKEQLVITPSLRPSFGGGASVYSVVFTLNGPHKLKSVRVVAADGSKSLATSHALWHVISDSNSVPTQIFPYGRHIRGMKQAPDNAKSEALEPDVPYHIEVEADGLKGAADFKTRALPGS